MAHDHVMWVIVTTAWHVLGLWMDGTLEVSSTGSLKAVASELVK
jgi:hypothetical protein